MNKTQVMTLLEANKNEKGVQKWENGGAKTSALKSFGIGLTALRKLAKEVGRDHVLAQELWESNVYDARVIALLIDNPKKISREQAEAQIEELDHGQLAHVFSSCDATLAKAPFVVQIASDWIKNEDAMRRRCGYGLLYEISKSKKKSAPDDAFFLDHITHIEQSFSSEERSVHHAMGVALMGIGMRNPTLHAAALQAGKKIGPFEIETAGGKCEPFDVIKHLTHDLVKRRLGL